MALRSPRPFSRPAKNSFLYEPVILSRLQFIDVANLGALVVNQLDGDVLKCALPLPLVFRVV